MKSFNGFIISCFNLKNWDSFTLSPAIVVIVFFVTYVVRHKIWIHSWIIRFLTEETRMDNRYKRHLIKKQFTKCISMNDAICKVSELNANSRMSVLLAKHSSCKISSGTEVKVKLGNHDAWIVVRVSNPWLATSKY